MISPSASTKSDRTRPTPSDRRARMTHAKDVTTVPRMTAANGWNFPRQQAHHQSQADDSQSISNKDHLNVSIRIDVAVNVAGQADVLLPKHNPVPGEDHQETT